MYFVYVSLWAFMHTRAGANTCNGAHMEVRGQLSGVQLVPSFMGVLRMGFRLSNLVANTPFA